MAESERGNKLVESEGDKSGKERVRERAFEIQLDRAAESLVVFWGALRRSRSSLLRRLTLQRHAESAGDRERKDDQVQLVLRQVQIQREGRHGCCPRSPRSTLIKVLSSSWNIYAVYITLLMKPN